ncbi:hypothetical protein KM043_005880 [Ampulex compressa]|nr:hypothetical protein KM043_005880 [Ampulex compressa]
MDGAAPQGSGSAAPIVALYPLCQPKGRREPRSALTRQWLLPGRCTRSKKRYNPIRNCGERKRRRVGLGRGLTESRGCSYKRTASLGQVSIPQSGLADRSKASNAATSTSRRWRAPPSAKLRNGPRSNAKGESGNLLAEPSWLKIQPSPGPEKGMPELMRISRVKIALREENARNARRYGIFLMRLTPEDQTRNSGDDDASPIVMVMAASVVAFANVSTDTQGSCISWPKFVQVGSMVEGIELTVDQNGRRGEILKCAEWLSVTESGPYDIKIITLIDQWHGASGGIATLPKSDTALLRPDALFDEKAGRDANKGDARHRRQMLGTAGNCLFALGIQEIRNLSLQTLLDGIQVMLYPSKNIKSASEKWTGRLAGLRGKQGRAIYKASSSQWRKLGIDAALVIPDSISKLARDYRSPSYFVSDTVTKISGQRELKVAFLHTSHSAGLLIYFREENIRKFTIPPPLDYADAPGGGGYSPPDLPPTPLLPTTAASFSPFCPTLLTRLKQLRNYSWRIVTPRETTLQVVRRKRYPL